MASSERDLSPTGAAATAASSRVLQRGGPGTRRGRHKVFLGMVAGVGKTYRMLQEARAEAEAGRDGVIGYPAPHGRGDTVPQAAGLEVVPRWRVRYRDTDLEEMDLPGILRRAPELCLID